jgi:hypothetical protein
MGPATASTPAAKGITLLFLFVGALAVAPLAWAMTVWTMTTFSTPVDAKSASYMVRPLTTSDTVRTVVFVTCAVVVVAAVVVLLRATTSGEVSRPWRGVVFATGVLACCYGLAYAVVTAPVTGANIGGGLLILAAPLLTIGAFEFSLSNVGRSKREAGPPPPRRRLGPKFGKVHRADLVPAM